MGAAENRQKSQAHAEFMKRMGITRTTGMCPMGCGGKFSITRANGLMEHLNGCKGAQRTGVRR